MEHVKELQGKLIYGYGKITLLELLSNDRIVDLIKLHKNIYIASSTSSILEDAHKLGYFKSIKMITFSEVQTINFTDSILLLESPTQECINNALFMKDVYIESTVLFFNKHIVLPSSSKDKIDVILIKGNIMKSIDNNQSTLLKIRLYYYIDEELLSNHFINNGANDDSIYIHYDGVIKTLDDLQLTESDNSGSDSDEDTQKDFMTLGDGEKYTLYL